MKDYFLNKFTTFLWTCIVLFVVTLAAYTSFGRLVTSNLAQYRETLVRELNAQLSFAVEVDSLRGSWSSFTPRIEFGGIRVLGSAHAEYAVEMDSLVAEIDVLDSIRRRSLQFFVLQGSGVAMHVDLSEDGQLSLPGFSIAPGGNLGSPLLDLLFNAEIMGFDDVTINLHDGDGMRQLFTESRLQSDGDFRRFQMSLLSPSREAWFRMIGEGSGLWSDLDRFAGRLHFSTSLGDVANYNTWFSSFGLEAGRGGLDAQLWFEIEAGQVEMAAEVEASELQFQLPGESGQQLELSGLGGAVNATNVNGVWNFDLNDLAISRQDEALELDRLSGQYDGRALVLRSENVAVQEVVQYLIDDPALPTAAYDVLSALSPRGQFERLQLKLADLDDFSRWRLEGNFRELGLDSMRGAPGIENAAGFVSLTRNHGRVQLASSEFSMDFPTVYREPLDYSEFSAELAWELRSDALLVRSGPFEGLGDEGKANGLFSLTVPLQRKTPAGVEMELMVGFADSDPRFRAKYLPFTLSKNLLDWLGPSIKGGRIVEGGFLWRGSLKQRQHRTVHLFFDVEAASLDYHSQWPSVSELDGLVLIADADVDVYAERARLLDSQVSDLRVSLRSAPNTNLLLNLAGHIEGDASDGLRVVNDSPLRDIVGDTFADWRLQGGLRTQLQLNLNLTDSSQAPVVQVNTLWDQVQLNAVPLKLEVDGVSGQLDFNTQTGFSATGVKGFLWGQELTADVSQERDRNGLGELDVAARGVVRANDLQAWLQQDILDLATGEAQTQLHIRVPRGGGAYLQASSALQGVALDLPSPWIKAAQEHRTLNLHLPLTSQPRRLMVEMDQALYLGVLLGEEGYLGGSLGFRQALTAEEPGYFLLGGEVERLVWEDWSSFLDRHVLAEGESAGPDIAATALVGVRELRAAELFAFGQRFEGVRLDAQQHAERWQVQVETDWLRGSAELPADFSRADISLDTLDVSGLSQGLESRLDALNPTEFSLPLLSVDIQELRDGESLWGHVSFDLRDEAQNYYFENIRGQLYGLNLGDEKAGMQLHWLTQEEDVITQFSGSLGFTDFGQVLAQYNYDPIIETESGRIDLALQWPGSPTQFSLSDTSGKMDIDVGEGRFLKTSGAPVGTLRVVSILNLADFVRRLSLDISYMFESGIPFHSIRGELQLDDGLIEVPGLAVTGPSSQFRFVGRADVPQERIDGELVATLPIASNLPWMAALISGLPAAAAVYVISKLFTKQMDRFSSAIYQVEGSWNDPSVTFQSIFNNSAEQKQVAADSSVDTQETAVSQ